MVEQCDENHKVERRTLEIIAIDHSLTVGWLVNPGRYLVSRGAARDGYLEALKEATKRELNGRDEDGMTPTLWAAFEGQLEALRLIVGRGGDPDKCDNYGNSALHFASARGHMNCVSFLVNFGVNMWALDIDFHTPKDLAAINNKDSILRFLDAAISREEMKDPKKVKGLQEKAEKEAEKRVKEFDKLQKKASKSVEEEQRKLAKQRQKMERGGGGSLSQGGTPAAPNRPTIPFMSLRSKAPPGLSVPKFSEIVSTSSTSSGSAGGTLVSKLRPTHFTGVYRKVQQRKTATAANGTDFKVADVEVDGKRSIRSLSGLRSDNSSVLYVPKFDISTGAGGRRGRIDGLFNDDVSNPEDEENDENERLSNGSRGMMRSRSQPDYLNQDTAENADEKPRVKSTFHDDQTILLPTSNSHTSIFERPGFGSVAFRSSLSATLSNFQNQNAVNSQNEAEKSGKGKRLPQIPSDQEDEENDEEDDDSEYSPVDSFLAAAGILSYAPFFLQEKIDLDALMLLTEEDLTSLGIPLGPRRKLLNAIRTRQNVMERPGELLDSRL